MKVTIIGAGNMGRGIGTRAVAGGNEVQLIDRDPPEAQALAEELAAAARDGGSATGSSPGDEITGEVVVLAVYYPGIKEAVGQYRDQLAGKIVVETTNPIDLETFEGLATPPGKSASEEIAGLLPEGTPVVKAFNTTFAKTLVPGEVAGQQLDVLIAGDDADAKQKVGSLVEAGGLRPIDVGPLRRAQQLEQLGFLIISLQEPLGTGFGSAIKLHW
jgi:8-hydroxy-5-deazaflavin:NADPH oxidoreductase